MAEVSPAETVWWINVVPLNRREKIARWWVEDVRQQHTYTSSRQREQEFTTIVPIEQIDALASESLKEALRQQRGDIVQEERFVTFPRATPDGSEYFGSVSIPRKPLNVRFTSQGIEDTPSQA